MSEISERAFLYLEEPKSQEFLLPELSPQEEFREFFELEDEGLADNFFDVEIVPNTTTSKAVDDFADLFVRPDPKMVLSQGLKRKSLDWDWKPLGKRASSFSLPASERRTSKTEFNDLAKQLSFDFRLTECSDQNLEMDQFIEMLKVEGLGKEWENGLTGTTPVTTVSDKQKRSRWTEAEIRALWKGIEEFGNTWRAIREKYLPDRTYYQTKDKGRRLLAAKGWVSSQEKKESRESFESAQKLAIKINKGYSRKRR